MTQTTTATEYRDIAGFPGYRVGDDGSVWSCWRVVGNDGRRGARSVLSDDWRRLKGAPNRYGHIMVSLYPGPRYRYVHRLVLEAFVGPCPPGMQCCHADGVPANNAVTNLRWDAPRANAADRDRHGRTARGERGGRSPLAAADVLSIRAKHAAGRTYQSLATEYGVNKTAIGFIVRRVYWRHV